MEDTHTQMVKGTASVTEGQVWFLIYDNTIYAPCGYGMAASSNTAWRKRVGRQLKLVPPWSLLCDWEAA